MKQVQAPEKDQASTSLESEGQESRVESTSGSRGNAYLQEQLAESPEIASEISSEGMPWVQQGWETAVEPSVESSGQESVGTLGTEVIQPGADVAITQEVAAQAPMDAEMELPAEAMAGLEEDGGGHASAEPAGDEGGSAPPPSEGPAGAPDLPPMGEPEATPPEAPELQASASVQSETSALSASALQPKSPELPAAPVVTGDGPAAQFIESNAQQVGSFISQADAMQQQIMAAAQASAVAIDTAIAQGETEVDQAIETARALSETDLTAAHAHIDVEAERALTQVETRVDAALARVAVAHETEVARLETSSAAQTAKIETDYSAWQGRFDSIGPSIGEEALALGTQRAAGWRGQKNGESTLLDGPIHDNRMEARAEAAENVSRQYQDSLIASAAERASAVQSGRARDLEAVTAMRQSSTTVLENQCSATTHGLQGNRAAGKARIEQTRQSLHQALDQRHASSGGELDQLETARHEQLAVYGGAQRDAVVESGAEAAETISTEATEAGAAMMGALHELQAATQGEEPALTTELTEALEGAQAQFNEVIGDASGQLKKATDMSAGGLRTSQGEIEGALSELTGESATGLKAGSDSGSQELSDFQRQSTDSFEQVLGAHDETLESGLVSAEEGFKSVGDGIEGQFGEMSQSLESGFSEGAQGLESGLRDSLKDEDQDISKYAEEAAGRVQPRWKNVLKVALIIAVIVVVCVVAGPLAAGLGAIGLSGLGAAVAAGTILGAAAGATIQMSHNMVDGRAVMDGVGKASLTGAVGGAFGGLGAGLAAGVGSLAGRIGVEFGLDAIGGVLGELAVGNAPTLEGILIGVGIGAGVGVGMRGVSAIKPKLRPDVSVAPQVEVNAPSVKSEAPAPAIKSEAPAPTIKSEAPAPKTQAESSTPNPHLDAPTPTRASADTPTPKARSRAKSAGQGDVADIRTQVEGRFGSDGAEAFDALVAATRNPKQAEATLRYAEDLDLSDSLVAMIRSGKLDTDSLRGLSKNVRAAQAEVLNGIDTGRYASVDDALKVSGSRTEILEAATRTSHGHEVSLGGRATEGGGRPAGKADLIDYTSGEAIQMKVVTGRDADAVVRNLDSATAQLGGDVPSGRAANAEIPPEGMQRVADIRIGESNSLHGASRAQVLDALQGRLSNLDNLDSTLTAHGQTTVPKASGEIRIDTGNPDGPFRFTAEELRGSTHTLYPEMPMGSDRGIEPWSARNLAQVEPATVGQKALQSGQQVPLDDGTIGYVTRVDGNDVYVDRAGMSEVHSRPDLLQRMGIESRQVDAQPGMDSKYAKETTTYQKFDGEAFNPDGPSPRAVNQGSLGDCWFMASMGATSRQRPTAIRKLVQDNGNGTYDVTLFVPGRGGQMVPSTKTVDMEFPTNGSRPLYAKTGDQNEWWAALLEKRLAMETGSYDNISGGNIGKHMRFDGGTELLTGQPTQYIRTGDQSGDQLLQTMKTAMVEGRPVTVDAHSESATDIAFNQAGKAEGVVFNHAYSVKEVDVESGRLTLDNPWGPNVSDLDIDVNKFQKFFRSTRITTDTKGVDTSQHLYPDAAGSSAGATQGIDLPIKLPESGAQASAGTADAQNLAPGSQGAGIRRAPGPEAEKDFLGGRTSDEDAALIMETHGINPDEALPSLNTIPEAWLPRYVELIQHPRSNKVSRKFNQAMGDVWGVKANSQDHAALAAVRATEGIRLKIDSQQLPTGKFGWDQYGNTPKEAMESLERLADVYRLMDNKVPTGNPSARARADTFLAMRDWIDASEHRVSQYFKELQEWRELLTPGMDPSVAMLRHEQLGLAAPPERVFQDLNVADLSPWRRQIDELGFDVERLRNPGVSGGRATREHWMDGQSVSADEIKGVADDAAASDAMNIGDQIASIQSGESRSAREVVAAAESGIVPRYVARVGKSADSFSNRASGDVYAADVADLRGLAGKPEEAMRMVGWERSWIDQAKVQGSDVYVTVVDTQAAGWRTGEIDMSGIQQTALRDIADPSTDFADFAAVAGLKPDDLPALFDELDQLAPGAPRPDHLKPFADALDQAYGLNSLYSGAGFTVTDEAISGRSGNVGAREVKVSGDNLNLDPAGRNVWWFSLKIGTLSPSAASASSPSSSATP